MCALVTGVQTCALPIWCASIYLPGEHIAEAALRLDDPVAELAPQAGDDRFDGIGVVAVARAIKMVGDLSGGNAPALLVAEEDQQAIFELRQLDLAPAERCGHPRGVDRQLAGDEKRRGMRSEEHTSELQSLMRTSYA